MASWAPNHKLKGKLVEQKISRLQSSEDLRYHQKTSTSLYELQNGSSRVKKLSKMFEEKSKTYSARTNWWLDEKIQQQVEFSPQRTWSSPLLRKSRSSITRENSCESPGQLSKLENIIKELLQKELSYIQALEKGIEYYVNTIKTGGSEVPTALRHQTFRLFGNIEEICNLHKNSVYPRLAICNGNARSVAETISSLIQNDLFYCYIIYAINQKSSEQLISNNYVFFEKLRHVSDDLLGIHSFLIQPIQKLPRYKILLDEMIKELGKETQTGSKETIAACCVAEKSVQRLLNRLNEALHINDIVETHEYNASVQMGILTTMQKDFGVNINEPMMLLVPKTRTNFPFRSPINVYALGKFINCSILKIQENISNKNFTGKVFLFEKCLLYTRMINTNTLSYRNHFSFTSGFSFITQESQVSFRVSGLDKKDDVLFSSDNIESIAAMKKVINQFYDPRRSADSAFVDGHELMISEDDGNDDQDMMSEDETDSWVVTETCGRVSLDQTVCIANSRFYVKSPEPDESE